MGYIERFNNEIMCCCFKKKKQKNKASWASQIFIGLLGVQCLMEMESLEYNNMQIWTYPVVSAIVFWIQEQMQIFWMDGFKVWIWLLCVLYLQVPADNLRSTVSKKESIDDIREYPDLESSVRSFPSPIAAISDPLSFGINTANQDCQLCAGWS